MMVVLETPYRHEPIPGIKDRVDKAVKKSLSTSLNRATNHDRIRRLRNIQAEYPALTIEEVYNLCPFSTFLETFPDQSDWTALYEFRGNLDRYMEEELKVWVRNIIDHLEQRLYPKSNPMRNH